MDILHWRETWKEKSGVSYRLDDLHFFGQFCLIWEIWLFVEIVILIVQIVMLLFAEIDLGSLITTKTTGLYNSNNLKLSFQQFLQNFG